jgi:hypothetical protein
MVLENGGCFLIPNMPDLIGQSESAPTSASSSPVVDEGLFWLFFGDELNPPPDPPHLWMRAILA